MAEESGHGDRRSLELAIKDAAKKKAQHEGTGISAATVDARVRQARYDRFLSPVFADGEASEWLLKGGPGQGNLTGRARQSILST